MTTAEIKELREKLLLERFAKLSDAKQRQILDMMVFFAQMESEEAQADARRKAFAMVR